jgi:hypothetical protein
MFLETIVSVRPEKASNSADNFTDLLFQVQETLGNVSVKDPAVVNFLKPYGIDVIETAPRGPDEEDRNVAMEMQASVAISTSKEDPGNHQGGDGKPRSGRLIKKARGRGAGR